MRLRAPRAAASARAAPHDAPRLLPGAVWLPRDALRNDVLYGQTFVVSRPRRGGPGLVVAPPRPPPTPAPPRQAAAVAARRAPARAPPPLRLSDGVCQTLDVEWCVVADVAAPRAALPPPRAGAALAVVPAAAAPPPRPGHHHHHHHNRPHPRRTAALRFTCNLCGGTTHARVNPVAWRTGTVFARCANAECGVIHKLVDNLGIVHEMAGPVFPWSGGRARRGAPPGKEG